MSSRCFTCACNVILLQFEPYRHGLKHFLYAIHASFLSFLYSLQLNQSLVETGPQILWMVKYGTGRLPSALCKLLLWSLYIGYT